MLASAERLTCLANDRLHLIVLPTEACNFRCVYCYEEFRHKRMAPEVVRGIKNLISRRASGLSQLTISWFGGEPLLARDVIEEVQGHARALAESHPTMATSADITTNGYLLGTAPFLRLVDLGVTEYQISVDGSREAHDRYRVLQGGIGTFDRIWSNLAGIHESPGQFQITVRVHVTDENASSIPSFLDEYAGAFGSDTRFRLFLRALSRLGGPNDAALPVMDGARARRTVEELRDEAEHRGLRQLRFRAQGTICYAARANSLVVRSNGRLSKCTVALEHPKNEVGRIHEDGTVALDREKMSGWMRGLATGCEGALRCPMKGFASRPMRSTVSPRALPLEIAS